MFHKKKTTTKDSPATEHKSICEVLKQEPNELHGGQEKGIHRITRNEKQLPRIVDQVCKSHSTYKILYVSYTDHIKCKQYRGPSKLTLCFIYRPYDSFSKES